MILSDITLFPVEGDKTPFGVFAGIHVHTRSAGGNQAPLIPQLRPDCDSRNEVGRSQGVYQCEGVKDIALV